MKFNIFKASLTESYSFRKNLKSFLPAFLILITISNLLIYLFMKYDISLHQKRIRSEEEKKVAILKRSTENNIRSVISDLMYLSLNPVFKQMVDRKGKDYIKEVSKLFKSFMKKTGLYDQVRFLDIKGNEKIRVNYRNRTPVVVKQNLLQNKSSRYYFKETIELKAGEIFMSPMDLNVEKGKIEVPYKPTIRFGTPVFKMNGEKSGILIINFRCSEVFKILKEESGKSPQYTVLLNSNGFWLKGLRKVDEWGFMLKGREAANIKKSIPFLWHKIAKEQNGQYFENNTLYTFSIVYPLWKKPGAPFPNPEGGLNSNPNDHRWIIATIIPEAEIQQLMGKTYRRWMIIYIVSFILVTLTSWGIGLSNLLKKEAIGTLEASRSKLEENIQERTLELLNVNQKLEKEVEDKKLSEKKIMHLNSVISAIRNINKLVVKIKDRNSLLKESCAILTQTRGYYNAWIGLLQKDGSLKIVAESGMEDYLSGNKKCMKTGDQPHCVKTLKSESSIAIIQRLHHKCNCVFSSKDKNSAGIASKLLHLQKLYGYVVISVSSDLTTDDEELKLIQELSEDLAYALYSIEQEESREFAEKALKIRTQELTLRLKELNCLFEISKVIETPNIRISQVIQRIVNLIPGSMKNSDRISARVRYANRDFQTKPFGGSETFMSEKILARGAIVGSLEVYLIPFFNYQEEEGFTREEINLIKVISERIGKIIEHSLTQRKNRVIEDALKESEEKYRLLIENANEAIFITIDGLIKFPNPKTEELLAATKKELINERFSHLVHPEDLPYYFHKMKNPDIKDTRNLNFRIVNNRSIELIVELSSVEVTWENKVALLNILRDVTKQKEMEESLRQSQKMEAIGTLAGGIAHDFNNILSAIFGYTELSLGKLENSRYLENNLKKILKAGTRARDLIQQILTFSRGNEMEFKPISISKIIGEVSSLLRASLPSTIEIKLNIKSEDFVMGDHVQIHQILMNLATNSGYAMRDRGGVLEISLHKPHKICNQIESEAVEMVISDTGEGIPEDIQSRILDPFFTTKPQGEGTGMGLSVVHGIVKSHKGRMWIKSLEKTGTSVTIQFPVIASPSKHKQKIKTRISGGNEKILFVDDESAITDIARKMLESLGYDVTTFNDSREAFEYFKESPESVDLLITDKTMPNITGEKLTKLFKDIKPDIPVIICTGFTDLNYIDPSLRKLIDTYLEKPFLKKRLAETIRNSLDKKRFQEKIL